MTARRSVYLSLGSNLGEREQYLRDALDRIERLPETHVAVISSIIETPPWGNTEQPPFLNMAAIIETALTPEALLAQLRAIEFALGRRRRDRWGPRTIDIDILIYEDETRDTEILHLPHPYLTQRRFVLAPLAEIAPDLCVQGKTVRAWLDALPASER